MAEFQEVMRQYDRMCSHYEECAGCPFHKNVVWCIKKIGGKRYVNGNAKPAEELIMSWAAEHPEPVYPSWEEWLLSVGGGKEQTLEIRGYSGNTEVVDFETHVIALSEPIPAETAKRLGVKPKEGTEWEN